MVQVVSFVSRLAAAEFVRLHARVIENGLSSLGTELVALGLQIAHAGKK
jgi:hypothetical protein